MSRAAYDADHDRVIDVNDAVYTQLRPWRDANGDEVSQTGELATLAERGVVAIDLHAVNLGGSLRIGAQRSSDRPTFRMKGGREGVVYDIWFKAER